MIGAFPPIMMRYFSLTSDVCVCLYTLGNVVRWYVSSLLGSYIQQEYYVVVIQM